MRLLPKHEIRDLFKGKVHQRYVLSFKRTLESLLTLVSMLLFYSVLSQPTVPYLLMEAGQLVVSMLASWLICNFVRSILKLNRLHQLSCQIADGEHLESSGSLTVTSTQQQFLRRFLKWNVMLLAMLLPLLGLSIWCSTTRTPFIQHWGWLIVNWGQWASSVGLIATCFYGLRMSKVLFERKI